MQLVNDQRELPFGMTGFMEPLSGLFEDVPLDFSHQHDVEHRIIGNENVRRRVLDVPTRPHLTAVHAWEKSPNLVGGAASIDVRLDLSCVSVEFLQFCLEAVNCCIDCARTGDGRLACISPERDAVACMVAIQPSVYGV